MTQNSKLKFAVANDLFSGVPYENTKGERKLEATVKVRTASWERLAKALSKLHVVTKKQNGPYMVFADFKKQASNGDYTRRNANVNQFYGVVLDIDETLLDFDEVKTLLDQGNLNYVLFTTYSYDPWDKEKEHKFRVVVPYSKPIDKEDQPFAVVGFATTINLEADFDHCSQTLSQPMYLHAAPSERASDALYACQTQGRFLDPDEAYSLGKLQVGSDGESNNKYKPLAPMGAKLSVGDRHAHMKRHMARRRKDGLALEEVIGELHAWNAKLDEPLADDQIEGLRRVWDTFDRNANSAGFEEHRIRINTVPLQQRDVYDNVMEHLVNSRDVLTAADYKELFNLIKSKRPGSTLGSIEEHFRQLVKDKEAGSSIDIQALRIKLFSCIKEEFADYVWLTDLNSAYHIWSRTYIKKEAFQSKITVLWGKLEMQFRALQLANKNGQRPINLNLMLEAGLIAIAADVAYNPQESGVFEYKRKQFYNQFTPNYLLSAEATERELQPLFTYFEYLFPGLDDRELMLDWLAFLIQRPGVKVRWAPVVYTPLEQMGKDLFMQRLVAPLLGAENVGRVSAEYLQEKYTEELTGRQLILLQELDFGRDKRVAQATANRMKPFLTDEVVPLRRFGMPGGQTEHYSSFMAFTNYADAAFMEGGGMRYYFIEGPKKRKPLAFYNKHADWFVKNTGECLWYFSQRDISKFPYLARPLNQRTEEMQRNTVGWPANVLNEALDNGELEGLTALPWKYFTQLLAVLSTDVDLIKVERLEGRGSARMQQIVISALERFGYYVVPLQEKRGLYYPTPESEGQSKNVRRVDRRWQKVIGFPDIDIKEEGVRKACKDSLSELSEIIKEVQT